jgi:hypothetical protein
MHGGRFRKSSKVAYCESLSLQTRLFERHDGWQPHGALLANLPTPPILTGSQTQIRSYFAASSIKIPIGAPRHDSTQRLFLFRQFRAQLRPSHLHLCSKCNDVPLQSLQFVSWYSRVRCRSNQINHFNHQHVITHSNSQMSHLNFRCSS